MPSPRPAPLLLLLTAVAALLGPACVPALEEGERSCPCAEGWTCCAGADVCVRGDAAQCPAVPVPDTAAPDAPRLDGTRPASPSPTTSVALEGRSEPLARVQVYAAAGCAGAPVAEVQAAASGAFTAPVVLAPDAARTFSARALDAAGNASACSDALTALHDGVPPATPELVGLAPASPSPTSTAPALLARAEPGVRVRLFSDAACRDALPFSALADAAGFAQVWARVAPDSRVTFHALAEDAAGNTSACTPEGLEFAHDATPPAPPALAGTTPPSPSPEPEATWSGTAEPGARVRVHATADCTDTPLDAATTDASGAWAVRLTAALNTGTQRYATSTDAAGNASACVALGTYVHDDVAPSWASFASFFPATPNNRSPTPTVYLRAEPDATVIVHGTLPGHFTDRELARVRTTSDGSASALLELAEGTTQLRLSVVDAAGNASGDLGWGATGTYEYDVTPPARPTARYFSEPVPNATFTALYLMGDAEVRTRVEVFTQADCAGTAAGETWAQPGWQPDRPVTPGYEVQVTPSLTEDVTYSVRVHDPAGNASECSAGLTLPRRPESGRAWDATRWGWSKQILHDGGDGFVWLNYERSYSYSDVGQLRVGRSSFSSNVSEPVQTLSYAADLALRRPELQRNARGDRVVTWADSNVYDGSQLRVARHDPVAAAWAAATAPAGALATADVALGADGSLLACWTLQPAAPAAPQRRCSRAAPGGAWEAAETLHAEAGSTERATGAGGALSVRRAADGALLGRVLAPGLGWGEDAPLAAHVLHFDVATADDGSAWLAYLVAGAGEADGVWVRALPAGAAQWEAAERVLAPPADGAAAEARVRVGAGGAGDVAVGLATSGRLAARLRTAAQGWGEPAVLAVPGEPAVPAGRFTLGAPGEAWFVWTAQLGTSSFSSWNRGGYGFSQRGAVRVARLARAEGWEAAQTLTVSWHDPDAVEVTGASASREPGGALLVSAAHSHSEFGTSGSLHRLH